MTRYGVARVMSKLGLGSRTQAAQWVRDGRVRVNGALVRDPEFPVRQGIDHVLLDDRAARPATRLVLMLNKPRGLVTTARDEQGRDTVYRCLEGSDLPWVAPVGRLDKASEGLLLFTNDPAWAARITSPTSGPDKTYHVQIDRLPQPDLLATLAQGVTVDGEHLRAKLACVLRSGDKNAWLEIVLDEGRNRQIRRLLAALDLSVLRLVRVAVGSLRLGELPKGRWRRLTEPEIDAASGVRSHG
jgi:23S rRNA pseudouridine2605 synthase